MSVPRLLRQSPRLALLLVTALSPGLGLAQTPTPAAPATSAGTRSPKTLSLAEYGKWNRITGASVSPNGEWATYTYVPNDGDGTLHVKHLDTGTAHSASVGSAPAGGGGGGGGGGFGGGAAGQPTFSDDSRFVGYFVNPPAAAARPGGARPGGGPAGAAPRPSRRFELLTLATGERFPVPNAATFAFASGGRWVAVRQNRAGTDTTRNGADLVLRELATGVTRNIGNVGSYAFNATGQLLAYTVDAPDKLGNGVYLVDLTRGETRPLHAANADFDQLTWSEDGLHLAALRGLRAAGNVQKDNVLLAWPQVAREGARAITWNPASDNRFVAGMVVSEFAALRWSDDARTILLGIKEQEREAPRSEEAQANVDVWHWKDAEPQSVQMVRLQQLRRATYPAAVHLADQASDTAVRFVRLGDDDMRTVTYAASGRAGVGRLDTPYRGQVAWGGARRTTTGWTSPRANGPSSTAPSRARWGSLPMVRGSSTSRPDASWPTTWRQGRASTSMPSPDATS